tara:strand:- start:861 stop:1517 length:657 start_codon:yes stop_codon:yes gene_type:complete
MDWNQIVVKYGFGEVRENYHHTPQDAHINKPERHEWFHCSKEPGGSEFEVCNFLNSFVKLIKPQNVLETGAEQGHGTVALAEAVQYNGLGHVTTVDNCRIAKTKVPVILEECSLSDKVTYCDMNSVEFADTYEGPPFDFVFFDCGFPSRIQCFDRLQERGKLSRFVSFHDVSHYQRVNDPQTEDYCAELDRIAKQHASEYGGIFNVLSRGFRLFQLAL